MKKLPNTQLIEKLQNLPKAKKLQIIIGTLVCVFAFYAVGIATNFFASPMFSAFFILSEETAHGIVTYLSIGAAVALGIGLAITIIKKRFSQIRLPQLKQFAIPRHKTTDTPSHTAETPITRKMSGNLTNKSVLKTKEKPRPKNEPTKQSISQLPDELQTEEEITQLQSEELRPQQSVIIQERLRCPACKKEFSQPLIMVEYTPKPTIVRHCPYCDQSIEKNKY